MECPSTSKRTIRAHLIGIGGNGMRALTDVLLGQSWELSGSDLSTAAAGSLIAANVKFHRGHAAEHVPCETDYVIHSDAIKPENPELRKAAVLGVPTCSYFDMVAQLSHDRQTLAVAGTHGKSTTTAMAAHIFAQAGKDPTVLCGATPKGRSSGGRSGAGKNILIEACEYRENFLKLRPDHAVVLGIEPDHFDYYRTPDHLEDAFARFVHSVPEDGLVLVRADCQPSRRVCEGVKARVETFGIGEGEWVARVLRSCEGCYTFEVRHRDFRPCEIKLPLPGRHNMLNALAASALACRGGVDPRDITNALNTFPVLGRRLESRGEYDGALIIDDYAHHPTEVSAVVHTVRQMHPERRLCCVFQPHQVSRTEKLLDELSETLQNADKVFVADIFRARDGAPKDGEVTAADLAAAVRRGGIDVSDAHTLSDITRVLRETLTDGDVLLTLGAGNIGTICDELTSDRGRREAA